MDRQSALTVDVETLIRSIHVPPKTEVTEVQSDETKVHALLRVFGPDTNERNVDGGVWWKDVVTAVKRVEQSSPWTTHICCEYRLAPDGDLGYIWNFLLNSGDLPSAISDIVVAISEVDQERMNSRRVPIDSVPLIGGGDRNVPKAGSKKGASLYIER